MVVALFLAAKSEREREREKVEKEERREERGGRKREKGRLAGRIETLKHNATIPLMEFL